MGRKLYVGNLTYGVTDSELQEMFQAHGTVQSAQVIMDRDTGRSKGFAFVEMGSDQEAQAAIAAMNGKEMGARQALSAVAVAERHGHGALRGRLADDIAVQLCDDARWGEFARFHWMSS